MSVKTLGVKSNAFQGKWIAEQIDDACIQFMEDFGFYLCDKQKPTDRFPGRNAVTISQIRNIFAEVKRIEVQLDGSTDAWEKAKTNFLMLKPKIAYSAARVLNQRHQSKISELKIVLEKAHSQVTDVSSFKRFSQLLEGIIAYHKVYGGKDN